MSLHHRDGRPVQQPGEWVREQLGLIRQWNLPLFERGVSADDVVHVWTQLFAKEAYDICDYKGVDIETFDALFPGFENRITPHLETLKWAMSADAGRDVDLEETCRTIHARVQKISNNGSSIVRLTMSFPNTKNGGDAHEESIDFPLEGSCESK